MSMKNGTLIEFHSGGSTYTGFIIGTCSYDNAGEDNAYVVRYVWPQGYDAPRKPYSIVDFLGAKPISEFPEDFIVGGYWSATPDDRCDEWVLKRDGDLLLIVANGPMADKN